jgi:uncharacterized membrane protein YeiH
MPPAALAAACAHVGAVTAGARALPAATAATAIGFALRAGAIRRGWTLPRYKPRPDRDC